MHDGRRLTVAFSPGGGEDSAKLDRSNLVRANRAVLCLSGRRDIAIMRNTGGATEEETTADTLLPLVSLQLRHHRTVEILHGETASRFQGGQKSRFALLAGKTRF